MAVFDTIITAVDTSSATAYFFLKSAGGTGKRYFNQNPSSYNCSQVFPLLCVATTGIVSLLLPGG
jgi:hypothetical protein